MLIGVSKREEKMLRWLYDNAPLLLLPCAILRHTIDLPLNLIVIAVCSVYIGVRDLAKAILEGAKESAQVTLDAIVGTARVARWCFTEGIHKNKKKNPKEGGEK